MTSFWKRALTMPPILCRLLARERWGRPLTAVEIADQTITPKNVTVFVSKSTWDMPITVGALTPAQVETISQCTSWDGIDIPTAQKFLAGCCIDFCNAKQMKRIDSYIRSNPTWKYLRTDKEWLTRWEPMIKRWMESAR